MRDRTSVAISLAVGILSIAVFLYSSGYYASLDDPTRIATTPYSLVMLLHLFVPVSVGASAAVMARGGPHRATSMALMCTWFLIALAALLVCVSYVRALVDFSIPSDHSAAVAHSPAAREGMARVAVALAHPFGRALVTGLMIVGLIAGSLFSKPLVRKPLRKAIAGLCGAAALLALAYVATLLMVRVSWGHYGGIHAFCMMAGCLMVLPLFMAAVNVVLQRIDVSAIAFVAWLSLSAAASVLVMVTVAKLWSGRVFLRETEAIAGGMHGVCAAMANRPLFGTVCVMAVLALAFLIARGTVRANE